METTDGTRQKLASKVPYQKVERGYRLIAHGPSGGGYGDPFRRDPAVVLDNVLDGLFSPEIAREHYAIVICWRCGCGRDRAAQKRTPSQVTSVGEGAPWVRVVSSFRDQAASRAPAVARAKPRCERA